MRLTDRRARTEKWYLIGWSPVLERYVLAVTVGWLAAYERYYAISGEEYRQTFTDPSALDALAEELYKAANRSERFLCSEKKDDNDAVQNELICRLLEEKNGYYSAHPEAVKEFVRI